jgi:membrane associated rhomboid family serine protease
MKRIVDKIVGFLGVVAALGAIAILFFLATQLVALALAVVIGIVVALASNGTSGVIAGVVTYAIVMKVFWYLDIFQMITSGKKKVKAASSMPPHTK